jgi:arylamine N-acetyltransferase
MHIRKNWKADWVEPALNSVRELWHDFQSRKQIGNPVSYENIPRRLSPRKKPQATARKFDLIKSNFQKNINQDKEQKDEYEEYCTEESYDIKDYSSLQWWSQDIQQQRWPTLSSFAIEILSIPAMSDEPERVFSGARRTISWERMSLGEKSVERTECLKSWIRNEIAEPGSASSEDSDPAEM